MRVAVKLKDLLTHLQVVVRMPLLAFRTTGRVAPETPGCDNLAAKNWKRKLYFPEE